MVQDVLSLTLSRGQVLSMRMDRMETKLEQLDQSLSRQLTRLTSLITNSAGVAPATDAAQTSTVGRSCGPERVPSAARGLEGFRRQMRASILKVSVVNTLAGCNSPPQGTNGQSRAPQTASYNPSAAEAALPTPGPSQPSETFAEGTIPDLPGRTQASLVSD